MRRWVQALGIAIGVLIGLFSLVRAGLVPLVAAIFPIPKIALLPLFVIWFGIDEGSKVRADRVRDLHADRRRDIRRGRQRRPFADPHGTELRPGLAFDRPQDRPARERCPAILSGLRISLAIAIILLVAAEMLGAEYGIGAYILEAGSLYDLERLFAGVVVLSLLGVIVSAVIGQIERYLLDWRS